MTIDYDSLVDRPRINGHVLTGDLSSDDLDIEGGTGHSYSLTEQVVGTWINGEPVYEITKEFDNTTSNDISINLTDCSIEHIIEIRLICNASGFDAVGYYNNSTDFLNSFYYIPTSDLHIRRGSGAAVGTGYAIIRYTKTTD